LRLAPRRKGLSGAEFSDTPDPDRFQPDNARLFGHQIPGQPFGDA